jgi:enoyl-CoA hydratase/carnithine racemase
MKTSYEHILVQTDGRVLTVTINRPEARNALHGEANAELAEVFDAFEADDALWVAIITGAGDKAFCAGNDLKATAAGKALNLPASGFGGLTSRFDCAKPIIAAVNGMAMGGGFEIALACDIVVADETAIFALPEARIGLAPLAGAMHRLPRKIGLARALPLLITGRRVSATEGKELGFVTEVATDGAIKAARRWADEIIQCSPCSVRAIKSVVAAGLEEPSLRAAMAAEQSNPEMVELFRSHDFREGPRAFVEKRAPVWKAGRAKETAA